MPKIEIHFERYNAIQDFDEAEQKLIQAAQEATALAYAPYSNFWVGAALLLADGTILQGANQENAAYPSGLCAERVAFFHAGCHHQAQNIQAVAVVARHANEQNFIPVTPCGACRQVMAEYESKQKQDIKIIFQDLDHQYYRLPNIAMLLPFQFTAQNLWTT